MLFANEMQGAGRVNKNKMQKFKVTVQQEIIVEFDENSKDSSADESTTGQ